MALLICMLDLIICMLDKDRNLLIKHNIVTSFVPDHRKQKLATNSLFSIGPTSFRITVNFAS